MEGLDEIAGYRYADAALNDSHAYLVPALLAELDAMHRTPKDVRVMDVGCGNGSVTEILHRRGHPVVGVDPSDEGVGIARQTYPHLQIERGSAYEPLSERYGRFDVVVSLEVVEHVYSPRKYAATVHDLLNPGGIAVISTPYHGYCKNVVLAVTGKMDKHFTALWDHGHIKFWSQKTLSALLVEAGFADVRFRRVGRVMLLEKSMVAIARK